MKTMVETWLKGQFGDDAELLESVYGEYRQTLAGLLDDLSAAMAAADRERIDRTLHTIKGSAAMVGDAETSSLAQAARALTDEAALRAAASRLRALCADL